MIDISSWFHGNELNIENDRGPAAGATEDQLGHHETKVNN